MTCMYKYMHDVSICTSGLDVVFSTVESLSKYDGVIKGLRVS